jgi:hypothetical protein
MENSESSADLSRTYRRHGARRIVGNVNVFNWQEDFEMRRYREIENESPDIFSKW